MATDRTIKLTRPDRPAQLDTNISAGQNAAPNKTHLAKNAIANNSQYVRYPGTGNVLVAKILNRAFN